MLHLQVYKKQKKNLDLNHSRSSSLPGHLTSTSNLWEELLFKKLFSLPAKKIKDVNRDKRKRMVGVGGRAEYELCSENKTDVKVLWNMAQKFSLISHFIRSGCSEIIQCLPLELADWKPNSLSRATKCHLVNSLPFSHLVPCLSRPWSPHCSSLVYVQFLG